MIEPYFTMSDEQMALYKSITKKMTQETLEDLIELLESVRSDGFSAGSAEVLYPDDIRHD